MAIPIPSDVASTLMTTSTVLSTVTSTISDLPPAATSPVYEKLPPTVGPIPLAAFIPMCFFAPFIIGFTLWILYIYTVKRWRTQKRMRREAKGKDPEADISRDVELQVRGFVDKPSKAKLQRENRPPSLGSVPKERSASSLPQPARVSSPLRKEWSQFRFDTL